MAKNETGPIQATMDELKLLFGDELTEDEIKVLTITMTLPTVNGRIDRKINMGNFESLGIGLSVNRPIVLPKELEPVWERLETEALRVSSNICATEMNKRVDRIKAKLKAEESK